jgi:hypothetical protein
MSAASGTLIDVSTKDQILSSELHGEALLAAKRPELRPFVDHLRHVAQDRDDIWVECGAKIYLRIEAARSVLKHRRALRSTR